MPWRVRVPAAAVLMLVLATGPSAAAEAAFDAHGSVEQVYVTGLAPGARVALVDRGGKQVDDGKRRRARAACSSARSSRATATACGPSGSGEQSEPLTVLTDAVGAARTDVYDQEIPPSGYGYLTTRDGTKLAINVHPPTDVASALRPATPPPVAGRRRRRR